MGSDQRGFLLYLDNYDLIEDLPEVEKGKWIDAVFRYKREKEIPDFQKGTLLNTAFKVVKSQLDRDAETWEEKRKKRADAGKKGGQAKASNAKQSEAKASNAKQGMTNLAVNVTDNVNVNDSVSVNDTDTGTVIVTETEQADADSASGDRPSASAAAKNAEPTSGDLFSLEQIRKKVKSGKVNLTDEGIEVFYEQMQEDGWTLYDEPVERKYILRALREWALKHPEYERESETEREATRHRSLCVSSLIKKATNVLPDGKFYSHWWNDLPQYCSKDLFTSEELELLKEKGVYWQDMT